MDENPYQAPKDEWTEPNLLSQVVARLPWYGYLPIAAIAIFFVGNGFLIWVENRLMAGGVPEAKAKLLTIPTELLLVGTMIVLMAPVFVLERKRIKRGETYPWGSGPPMPHRAQQLVKTVLVVAVIAAVVGLIAVDRLSRP